MPSHFCVHELSRSPRAHILDNLGRDFLSLRVASVTRGKQLLSTAASELKIQHQSTILFKGTHDS